MKTVNVQDWIVGLYDNKIQAGQDLINGKPTARKGGHEYVEASITKVDEGLLIASYWFGNDPSKTPFRFRLYQLVPDKRRQFISLMKLYKPTDETNAKLKAVSFNLKEYLPSFEEFELLQGCDVGWSEEDGFLKGVLVEGSCTVCSQNDPTVELTIKDELFLWEDALWINDRVYTKTGQLVIGNTEGIPYKMVKSVVNHLVNV